MSRDFLLLTLSYTLQGYVGYIFVFWFYTYLVEVRHFDLMASTRLSLKPGAIDLLDALDDLRLPRAIATSSAHHTVEHHLTAHNLVGRFHEIVGHGDYASGKPAPDPFLKARAFSRLRAECLKLVSRFVRREQE